MASFLPRALQYIIKDKYDGGAMITASHNPPEYNGVKIIEPDGTEMGDEETIRLEQLIFEKSGAPAPWNTMGQETSAPQLIGQYIKSVTDKFPEKPGTGMTVVVNTDSGPACLTSVRILTEMGCRVLTINGVIDRYIFPAGCRNPLPRDLSRCQKW